VSRYTILLDAGLLVGAVVAYLGAQRRGLPGAKALDLTLLAGAGGLIGARIVYVAANWAYFAHHHQRAVRFWEGGLAWHGALAGGLLAVLASCAIRRTSPLVAFDVLGPAAAALAAFGWLGCLFDRCAYGLVTYPGQGLLWRLSLELPDTYGIRVPRVAVQALGAAWSAIAFLAVAVVASRREVEGLALPLWLALYCTGSFLLGCLRADDVPLVAGWRADQAADLALVVVGISTLAIAMSRTKRRPAGRPHS
jgi:phosphatidylglycerol:prolipoprotein diacylglycerol transferase